MQFLNQLQAELKIGFWTKLDYAELLPDFLLQSETCLGSESQSKIIEKADLPCQILVQLAQKS